MRPLSADADINLRYRFRERLASRCSEGEISHARHDREVVPDELLYRLLRDAQFSTAHDEANFRQAYAVERKSVAEAPDFEDLIGKGWFNITWGRVRADWGRISRLKEVKRPELAPLLQCLIMRGPLVPEVPQAEISTTELKAIGRKFTSGKVRLDQLSALRPAWIAARLWEDAPRGDPGLAMRWWCDRWEVLEHPELLIHREWTEDDAQRFRSAALEVLEAAAAQMSWAEFRNDRIAKIGAGRDDPAEVEDRIPPVPEGFVGRSEWLARDTYTEEYSLDDPFNGIVRVLLDEAAIDVHSLEGRRAARKVLDLARRSPEILNSVKWHLTRRPVLIAEAVCEPTWNAMAYALIAKQIAVQKERRGFTDEHDRAGLEEVLGEAADVMLTRLAEGALPAIDVADLLVAMRRPVRLIEGVIETPRRYEILLAKIVDAPKADLVQIATHLLARAKPNDLDDLGVATLLDLLARVDLLDHLDPNSVIKFYVDALNHADTVPRGLRLSVPACGALYLVSEAAGRAVQNQFFRPIDITHAFTALSPERSEIFAEHDLARALRAHMRVLARAITALGGVEDRLVEALCDAIRVGAHSAPAAGTIAAFAPRHEHGPTIRGDEAPLADDLATAIAKLNPAHKARVFSALEITDEPYILAQLAARSVGSDQAKFRLMAERLSPGIAGKTHWGNEDQVRAEALLDAGLPDLAEQFDQNGQAGLSPAGLKRLRLASFRNAVRIAYERKDAQTISDMEVPNDLAPFEVGQAQYILDFYRALIDLTRIDGADDAVVKFERLVVSHPHSRALKINLHAAEASVLIRGDVFQILEPEKVVAARDLIDRGKALLASDAADDPGVLASNNAMLQLAAGDPQGAIASVEAVEIGARSPEATAYLAIGYARTGNKPRALEILRTSPWSASDRTGMLAAAKAQINDHLPFAGAAQFVDDVDRVRDIKAALTDLRNLEPSQQAKAGGHATLSGLVRHHMVQATSALAGMAPALGELAEKLHEDSFSFVLRQILISRVDGLGWSVGDQSKSGYSGAGKGTGERDLDIRKQTMDVSIVEAVIWRQNDQVLLSHFQKLFGYGAANVFVYLAYVLEGATTTLLGKLEAIAKDAAPDGFAYIDHEVIPLEGSEPVNFTARYSAERGPVAAHFFLIDLSQAVMRNAAATAARSAQPKKPRKPSSKQLKGGTAPLPDSPA